MNFTPAASQQAGAQAVRQPVSFRAGLAALTLLTLAFLPISVRADKAQDTLKRMADVYRNAKSFDGTITVVQSMKDPKGKSGFVTTVQKIRYKAPNRFYVDMKVNGTGVLARIGHQSQIVACDGKQILTYDVKTKLYHKLPTQPNITFPQLLMNLRLMIIPDVQSIKAKISGSTTVNGRAATNIQIKPPAGKMDPRMTPEMKKQLLSPVTFVVDKSNFHLVRIVKSFPGNSLSVNLLPQSVNSPIPDRAFSFTLPAGAKEGPMPRPGGMPQRR